MALRLERVVPSAINAAPLPVKRARQWGFGAPGSPVRNYFTGYAAARAGQYESAITAFTAFLDSGLMEERHEQVRGALAAIRAA